MTLPEPYASAIADLPAEVRAVTAAHCQRYLDAAADTAPQDPAFVAQWVTVCACSDFVPVACARAPALVADLQRSGDLARAYGEGEYAARAAVVMQGVGDEQSLMVRLRQWRRREMVRIAWRDLNRLAPLDETLRELTYFADAVVDAALTALYAWQCAEEGAPCNAAGVNQRLCVIGMGKMGAFELNFSSDIDLIFTFPEEGETRFETGQGGARSRSNGEFFVTLCRRLVHVLDSATADGFVFRVDTRLRPFGDVGQLALSFDAMEQYYQTHGREWERYAMIKARIVAGDREQGAQLLKLLQPFVYRRYLDYGAFESLREMKQMIGREVARKGMEDNVKLGAGGIREIEFIGQAFQLIRGGREMALRERAIQPILRQLAAAGLLPVYVVEQLLSAYDFLRRAENRIQAYEDKQTHLLPKENLARLRLALAMGFDDWQNFERALRVHMRRVHEHFDQVFAAPQTGGDQPQNQDYASVWAGNLPREQAIDQLRGHGFGDADEALRRILSLRQGRLYQTLSPRGRDRLDRLMPLLLSAAAHHELPDTALPRALDLIEAVAKRTAYLALLVEHPLALSQLVKLCAASPWIARLLTRYPLLLDELLDPRALYTPLSEPQLAAELAGRLSGIAEADVEMQMDILRQFKQANVLKVAAADVAGVTPLMVVSDHLTYIADVTLQHVYRLAWRDVAARHGVPQYQIDGTLRDAAFGIVGYGKLGGLELGYGSDLDVVFLHDSRGDAQQTSGPAVLDNATFFARVAQRLMHYLTAPTAGGVLYEVDTRLRPSGASGLLVSSLEAYAQYQRREAWTWEHQALIRARYVGGDPTLAAPFAAVRAEIITRPRDPPTLAEEVREMRAKMRKELDKPAGKFNLKHGAGGVIDIEFLVQFLVLREAARAPEVCRYTDNIRQLDALAQAGVLSAAEAADLAEIYRGYRKEIHRLTLQELPTVMAADAFAPQRARVQAIWAAHLGQ